MRRLPFWLMGVARRFFLCFLTFAFHLNLNAKFSIQRNSTNCCVVCSLPLSHSLSFSLSFICTFRQVFSAITKCCTMGHAAKLWQRASGSISCFRCWPSQFHVCGRKEVQGAGSEGATSCPTGMKLKMCCYKLGCSAHCGTVATATRGGSVANFAE